MNEAIKNSITPAIMKESVDQLIKNLENENYTRAQAIEDVVNLKTSIQDYINSLNPSKNKHKIIDQIFNSLYEVLDAAVEKYHNYSIELPIQLEEGAIVPTYAHDDDAAADLYALQDTNLNANTYGNRIHTGVHIQLPEGWLALIIPRSSIGAKTSLRLSNSVGLIDSGYRGELGVLYDNTSDNDTFIKKGDRVAQLLVMPSYRFKAKVVESLEDSERGSGGFGSTGK
jgi:dUTP pyrophosphatase